MLGRSCLTEPCDNAYRVLRLKPAAVPLATEEKGTLPISLTKELFTYLPPPVTQALKNGAFAKGVQGEHRKVSTIFINLLGG